MAESSPVNPLRVGLAEEAFIEPRALVIFGASGDLTRRKLLPAIYNLSVSRGLPTGFAVVGVARRPKTNEAFANEMREAVAQHSRRKPIDASAWNDLASALSYVQGTFENPSTYEALARELARVDREHGTRGGRIYYLAVPPSEIRAVVEHLRDAGLLSIEPTRPVPRVIVEKPFGRDLDSATRLNRDLAEALEERQIFRIDHYLGKETVQNLLVLRFGNSIFEPIWNRNHIDYVEITVAEDIGIEGRGNFYEETGIVRDIVQNHALQLLCLVAMEPPVAWDADAVRDEKVKVLRALSLLDRAEIARSVVRGQYTAGKFRGDEVMGYRQEPDVKPDSQIETFIALRMTLESWRWANVPFYLRAGKRLAKRVTEIAVHFRQLPQRLFRDAPGAMPSPNVLVLRIQPDEGIALRFATKIPGPTIAIRNVAMDFRYGAAFGTTTPEAYERLLLDAMRGDATLFTRRDEVEAQWRFVDPLLQAFRRDAPKLAFYPAGSFGPLEADELVRNDGRVWRRP